MRRNTPQRRRGIRRPQGVDLCPISGKRKYGTEDMATAELHKARKLRREQGKKHVEDHSYLCVSCMTYHLTSKKAS